MFDQFFGEYLIRNSIISKNQFDEVRTTQDLIQVKLGFIAVSKKLLTPIQADEINHLQTKMDKRFGDIAVEKGYLTQAQVNDLLCVQGNPYYMFVQSLIMKGFLTLEEIDSHLNTYKSENGLSDNQLDAIKSGDIDRILPIFVSVKSPYCLDLIGLALRNVVRFIDNHIRIEKGYYTKEYTFEHLVCQQMQGEHDIFAAFSSKEKGLLKVASPFAKEDFKNIDEDSVDSIGEFINCIDGLLATKLSNEGIKIDMLPPLYYSNQLVQTDDELYVLPIYIDETRIDFIVSIDQILNIVFN